MQYRIRCRQCTTKQHAMKLVDIFGDSSAVDSLMLQTVGVVFNQLIQERRIDQAVAFAEWYKDQTSSNEAVAEVSQGAGLRNVSGPPPSVFRQSFFMDALHEMLPTHHERWQGWGVFSNASLRPDIFQHLKQQGRPAPQSVSDWQRLSDALKRSPYFDRVKGQGWRCLYSPTRDKKSLDLIVDVAKAAPKESYQPSDLGLHNGLFSLVHE